MMVSMTGYGHAEIPYKNQVIVVDIRSLNSKYTDLRFKIPATYKSKEPDLRKMVLNDIKRGKIDLTIEVRSEMGIEEYALNPVLFKKYYRELQQITSDLGVEQTEFLQSILRIPNVVQLVAEDIDEKEYHQVIRCMELALEKHRHFREAEGQAMEQEAEARVKSIRNFLTEIPPLEAERLAHMRKRIWSNLEEFLGKEQVDANRFEQEVLYYLEKMDITEEKVRLAQHCDYFLEEMQANNDQKGRKLSFISQEIGREINTLGAKANSSTIQRIVVQMKDDLEKIKEILANIA